MKNHIFFVACYLQLAACDDPYTSKTVAEALIVRETTGIVGGQIVTEDDREARNIVMIRNHRNDTFCTGTLIASDLVLTAGHCLPQNPAHSSRELVILFGLNPSRKGEGGLPVVAAKRHSRYKDYFKDDIAVLRFRGELPEDLSPARLPDLEDKIEWRMIFTGIGYGVVHGRRRSNKPDGAGVLRHARMEIASFKSRDFSADQTNGVGTCSGDSGGPAMTWKNDGTPVVVGVASSGYRYAKAKKRRARHYYHDDCKYESLFMNTYAYREWIHRASKELSGVVNDKTLIMESRRPSEAE